MPSLNLRLSDEEHEWLVAAAAVSRRSLQQEIMARVFVEGLPVRSAVPGEVLPELPAEAYPLGARELPAVRREVQVSSSGCPGYVPAGVRCKLCGQVHQPKGRKQ